ncbi:hypothetical protein M011DRAFT_463080 [Sporormia fimetaria CBS 119925]|uniref:Uncharacterized protein n=1 Tax=Sporormia fimetaria CBS 119925 TaxID=1340428 RepID=A0A6A6UVY4_9PLEO|nr:hypothetical protein M011DRAFT_463080 [Sporormia fimetaria CBS 119925]
MPQTTTLKTVSNNVEVTQAQDGPVWRYVGISNTGQEYQWNYITKEGNIELSRDKKGQPIWRFKIHPKSKSGKTAGDWTYFKPKGSQASQATQQQTQTNQGSSSTEGLPKTLTWQNGYWWDPRTREWKTRQQLPPGYGQPLGENDVVSAMQSMSLQAGGQANAGSGTNTAQYNTNTAQYNTAQYNTAQYNTAKINAARYSTADGEDPMPENMAYVESNPQTPGEKPNPMKPLAINPKALNDSYKSIGTKTGDGGFLYAAYMASHRMNTGDPFTKTA